MNWKIVVRKAVPALAVLFCGLLGFLLGKDALLISKSPGAADFAITASTILSAFGLMFKNKFGSDVQTAIEWASFVAPTTILLIQKFGQ